MIGDITFKIKEDGIYKYTEITDNQGREELIISKDMYVEAYDKWIKSNDKVSGGFTMDNKDDVSKYNEELKSCMESEIERIKKINTKYSKCRLAMKQGLCEKCIDQASCAAYNNYKLEKSTDDIVDVESLADIKKRLENDINNADKRIEETKSNLKEYAQAYKTGLMDAYQACNIMSEDEYNKDISYDNNMIEYWMSKLKGPSGLTINDEIEDVKGTISNETLWLKGAKNQEQIIIHMQNIANLKEYMKRLDKLIDEDRIFDDNEMKLDISINDAIDILEQEQEKLLDYADEKLYSVENKGLYSAYSKAVEALEVMPDPDHPAELNEVEEDEESYYRIRHYKCSECENIISTYDVSKIRYCPYCGYNV